MKYLGIDYGTKRIGVAVSNDDGTMAFPHSVVAAGPKAVSEIDTLIQTNGVGAVVLGESRNLQGAPNAVQEDIEQFKKDLEELTGLVVAYQSEFFSSAAAARQFTPDGSRKENPSQEKLDASAAALILQSYLDTLPK